MAHDLFINANDNDGHAVYPTAEHPAVFAGVFQHTLFILCKVAVVQAFYFIRDEFSIFRFWAVFVEDGFEPFHNKIIMMLENTIEKIIR
jgi:hypothetical protein